LIRFNSGLIRGLFGAHLGSHPDSVTLNGRERSVRLNPLHPQRIDLIQAQPLERASL
jgi:hypothetical protein